MKPLAPPLLLAAALSITASVASAAAGPEIPRPVLTEMEPHVQRQLRDARQELDSLLSDPEVTPSALAAALGRMGQIYHAYDLGEPAEACYRSAAELAPGDYRWHYYLGLLNQRSGRGSESIAALERALELSPGDPATLLRLADEERANDRLERAEELYRRLLERPSTEAAGLKGLAQIATARGQHDVAARYLERALAVQPSATRLHYLLAIAYRRLGEMDKARSEIALQGTADIAFPDPLLAELSGLASGAAVSLQRGYYAAFSGFDESAIEDYRRAVEADPDNPEAHRSLAGALADSGDHAGAIEQLRQLLLIDPNPAGAHFTLAETLESSGSIEEALPHYQAAVDKAPDFRAFRLALARALVRAGRLEDSSTHLRRMIEIDEHDMVARIDLGEVLLAKGDTERAAAEFQTVLAGDAGVNQRAAAHQGMGRVLAAAGALEPAIVQYELALDLVPEYHSAHLGLASLLGRSGRFGEAAGAFRRALDLEPSDEGARLGEATALLLGGDAAGAVERLEEGAELLPESTRLADTLARLLAGAPSAQLRDGERALAIAQRLFELEPSLHHAETLAMALAETGRFEEAVLWQERVVAEVARLGDSTLLATANEALAAYRRGEPYRFH